MRTILTLPLLAATALLAACATSQPAPSTVAPGETPAQWQAPLPHSGHLSDLTLWWQQFNDPLLADLLAAAQRVSPNIASASARIEQARAARVAAGASLGPTLNANASASRGRPDLSLPTGTTLGAGLQAAWELDLFGGARAGRDAAQARLEGAEAGWHDARVAVAAEVANSYVALRACEAQVAQAQVDATSRGETSRLTELAAQAGSQAPASAALARASAAQASSTLTQQRAACDLNVKALVALSGIDEPLLRSRLAERSAQQPQPAQIAVTSVPAEALAQRPDLYTAARELVAASADVSQAQARRLPSVSLAGSIGAARFSSSAGTVDGTTWNLGPLSVTLPLFDGGVRRANVDAARARYDAAVLGYRAQLRTAVREVEEALVVLQSTDARSSDAQVAVEGFDASFRGAQTRYKGGLASLFELEDARRNALQAQIALIELRRERTAAWIALYRALGGGWKADAPPLARAAD